MTKLFSKKPHPAKAARILASGASATAFMSMITVFSFNAHSAAALAPVDSAVPLGQSSATPTTPASPASATPAPTTNVIKAAAPKVKVAKKAVVPATVKKATPKKAVAHPKAVAPSPKATVTSKPVVVPPVTTPTQGTSGGSRKP